jgi:integrase
MAFSGARRNEALSVMWTDIDWARRIVLLNTTKYGRPRAEDLNPRLEAHLKEMLARRSESEWLFPSPCSAPGADAAASNLQASLQVARTRAGLPDFCFHDLRHYFISACAMAGIDYMTIANWVGHKDGGVLIGRVYGHLNDPHAKAMAAKLV